MTQSNISFIALIVQGLGELDIKFDKNGVVESCKGTIKIPYVKLYTSP